MNRPRILVTPDVGLRQVLGVDRRVYELNAVYCDAVYEHGGMPYVAPYVEGRTDVAEMLDGFAGLVLTGGDYDVDPRLYGEAPHPKLGPRKPARSDFEMALLDVAETRRLPVLGVCAGMQIMNVRWKGSLWQDLPDQHPTAVDHRQKFDRRRPSHAVDLVEGSLLARIYGALRIRVNSNHHQAVRDAGVGVVLSGVGEDGVVEALEHPGLPFAVGVQWHPEMLAADEDDGRARLPYRALVAAARRFLAPDGR